jgi:ABC-type branched-subunit amino acid transport system substrate-binding protein
MRRAEPASPATHDPAAPRRTGARPSVTLTASLLALALLLVACGARLTEEQHGLAVEGGVPGAGGQGTGPAHGPDAGDHESDDGGQLALGEADGDGGAPDEVASTPTSDGADAGGEAGEAADGPSDGGAGRGGADEDDAADEAWRRVPDGGNGGATDVGVTEDTITLANVSDVSGVVPGLFEDAQMAAAAYLAYHNATQGPIYGRQLQLLPLDSRMDTGANRQQYLRACDEALAGAGSMSAFEEGAVDPVANCGIPDLRATVGAEPMQKVETVYSVLTQEPGRTVTAEYHYWAEQHPEAVKRAGFVFADIETTRFQSAQTRAASEQVGFEWIYVQPVQPSETNYHSFVLDMIDAGVEYVVFQGDYSQAVRLANAMRQQNYWPEVYALQTNAYTPSYIESGGSAVEGTHIAVATALIEEIDQNEELQLYAEWLGQVDPSARPTAMGMLAWSGAKLVVEGLKQIGPEVTREALIDYLDGVTDWTGNGLHGGQNVGPKKVSSCITIVEVRDGRFQRLEPSDGFRCEEPVDVG